MSSIKIDKLVRSNRRTLALIIESDGAVIVRAPLKMPQDYINKFIQQKQNWIIRKQNEIKLRQNPKQIGFEDGRLLYYLGKTYPLRLVDNTNEFVSLSDCFNVKSNAKRTPQLLLLNWYFNQAYKIFSERCKHYSALTGYKYKSLKVSTARTRWGSCSHQNALNLSWRLIMAPVDIIDYVVVHELVHIKHKNHSSSFWNNVAKFVPDYHEKRQWLKINSQMLNI